MIILERVFRELRNGVRNRCSKQNHLKLHKNSRYKIFAVIMLGLENQLSFDLSDLILRSMGGKTYYVL